MALFDLECGKCKHVFEGHVRISEDKYTEPCPNCKVKGAIEKVFLKATQIVSGVNLAAKVPSGFKDVLKKLKKANPLGNFDGELS